LNSNLKWLFFLHLRHVSKRTKYEIGLLIILGTLGTFCLNFALANISIIMFAVIGLIEPVIGLSISKLYHKEKLSRIQQWGIAAGVVAAFILSATK
jgi:drug/metabolite transporter (DMT)-like permease